MPARIHLAFTIGEFQSNQNCRTMPLNGIYWSQINCNDIVGLFHRINAAYNIDCILITNKIILLIFLIWLAAIFPEIK